MENPYEKINKKFLNKKIINPNYNLHNINIPFRMSIIAPSGSGKTSFLYNLIEKFSTGNIGTFHSILIFTVDKDEPLYNSLEEQGIMVFETLEMLPDLNLFNKDYNYLVIIDDMQLEKKQDKICEYFIRCRKCNVCIAYLAQDFFKIPIVIRSNSNYFVLLKGIVKRDLNIILKEAGDDKNKLLKIYEFATKEKFNVLIIDRFSDNPLKKLRKNFLEYIIE